MLFNEIYGVSQHVKDFCHSLQPYEFDVFCPNLLEQETVFDYSQEKTTNKYFMEEVGFTAAWLCSEEIGFHGIVGYYGSRIRDYLEITPECPALLFYSQEEKFFNVNELMAIFDKKNPEIHKFNGQHGFSDPFSPKYNAESARQLLL